MVTSGSARRVGPTGEVVAVWTAPDGLGAVTSTTVSAAGACFPDPATDRPVEARITVHTPELAAVTPIAGLTLAHITVQPMPGGAFLVAGARCRWRRDGPDRNGVLYDTDGQVVAERVLGDGIGHVLATSSGQVWIGYFDEGIYGNCYGPDHDRLALAELGADRARPAVQYWVVLPGGEPLPAGTQVIGRGSRLHFLTGTSWYQLDVDDIPA
jgi:hypothetical protein